MLHSSLSSFCCSLESIFVMFAAFATSPRWWSGRRKSGKRQQRFLLNLWKKNKFALSRGRGLYMLNSIHRHHTIDYLVQCSRLHHVSPVTLRSPSESHLHSILNLPVSKRVQELRREVKKLLKAFHWLFTLSIVRPFKCFILHNQPPSRSMHGIVFSVWVFDIRHNANCRVRARGRLIVRRQFNRKREVKGWKRSRLLKWTTRSTHERVNLHISTLSNDWLAESTFVFLFHLNKT